jgi:L-asparaginase / beta-aspartyl-peptidase
VVVHAGAGARSAELDERCDEYRSALLSTIGQARAVLEQGGPAMDAAQAAVAYMEDQADLFNAGRGSVLCADGSVEMSAALMRGSDCAAGAVTGVSRSRHPIQAARAVLEHSPHVLLAGAAADRHAAASGVDQRDPSWFITERQRRRLAERGADVDRGTVGAVCLDAGGQVAAATSTGGRRGQVPGRVGDSPLPGAGTWADARVAVSCTGDGEAFIRAGVARHLATLLHCGHRLSVAAEEALAGVAALGGEGGLIAVGANGEVVTPFNAGAMPRAIWRDGSVPEVQV